jgi:hypothetical protein
MWRKKVSEQFSIDNASLLKEICELVRKRIGESVEMMVDGNKICACLHV